MSVVLPCTPEEYAERFLAAMAEAGFPRMRYALDDSAAGGSRVLYDGSYPLRPEFWRSWYRANIVCGGGNYRCFTCFVREKKQGLPLEATECTHDPEVWV